MKLEATGRGSPAAAATADESGVTVRVDDLRHTEYWAEVRLTRDDLRRLLVAVDAAAVAAQAADGDVYRDRDGNVVGEEEYEELCASGHFAPPAKPWPEEVVNDTPRPQHHYTYWPNGRLTIRRGGRTVYENGFPGKGHHYYGEPRPGDTVVRMQHPILS